jgi:hypothetical protein
MSNIFKLVSRNENDNLVGNDIYTYLYTKGLWPSNSGTLLSFNTSSVQNSKSKEYYIQVWQSSSVNTKENEMFSIAYGNRNGLGSKYVSDAFDVLGQVRDTSTRAVYSQYKLLCLDGDESGSGFFLQNSESIDHFYALNINRNRFGDKLDPGNFEINIAELNGNSFANSVYTGSNVQISGSNHVISLIDDSLDALDIIESSQKPSVSRNLVSGSIANGIYNASSPHYYGKVYPEQGVILISAEKLNASASFNTFSGSNADGENSMKLFTAMSGSASNRSKGFVARSVVVKHQESIFIRVNGNEMNYSNNPTFVNKDIRRGKFNRPYFDSFIYNPYTYVTTVGLYNDNKDLLAVAKLSKPLQKSFSSEISITVKLEY